LSPQYRSPVIVAAPILARIRRAGTQLSRHDFLVCLLKLDAPARPGRRSPLR
jgi:hypothetical protein